jgi:hypothetical protein
MHWTEHWLGDRVVSEEETNPKDPARDRISA